MTFISLYAQNIFVVLEVIGLVFALVCAKRGIELEWPALVTAFSLTGLTAWRLSNGNVAQAAIDLSGASIWAWIWWNSRKRQNKKKVFALLGEKSRALIEKLVRTQEEGSRA